MEDLVTVGLGLAGAVAAVAVPFLVRYIRKLVAESENKVDDKVLAAVEKALAEKQTTDEAK